MNYLTQIEKHHRKRLFLDVDGVVADLVGAVEKLFLNYNHPTEWNLFGNCPEVLKLRTLGQLPHAEVKSSVFFEHIYPAPNFYELYVDMLPWARFFRDARVEAFVSAEGGESKKNWLSRHFPSVPLIVMADKSLLFGPGGRVDCVLVDDNPALSSCEGVITFPQRWNYHGVDVSPATLLSRQFEFAQKISSVFGVSQG